MGKNPDDVNQIDSVEREVDELRIRTEELLAELERRIESKVDTAKERVGEVKEKLQRVKHAVDLPSHARNHPRAAAGIGVGTAAALGLGVWYLIARRIDRDRWQNRARRRAVAYRALLADPERALAPRGPSLMKRLVGALLITLATAITKRLIGRGFDRALPPRRTSEAPA